jgi:MYXO-CTERM domain-containing protein
MMRSLRRLTSGAAVALALVAVAPTDAGIVNGSFETGDFSGWTVVQPTFASVSSSELVKADPSAVIPSTPPTWAPTHGNHFAYLKAGADIGRYTLVSQAFTAHVGDVVAFDIFFDAGDYLPFNDNGFANILNVGSLDLDNLYMKDIAEVGSYGEDGWHHVEYLVRDAGEYVLLFGVNNDGDNKLPSFLGVDDVYVGAPGGNGDPVPEPTAMLVWSLVGAGGLALRRRRVA